MNKAINCKTGENKYLLDVSPIGSGMFIMKMKVDEFESTSSFAKKK